MTALPNWNTLLQSPDVLSLIQLALDEDVGQGDITTASVFPESVMVKAHIVARSSTIACGLPLANFLFQRLNPSLQCVDAVAEGTLISPGDSLLTVCGDVRAVLTAERCVLNYLMRLCGIAMAAHTAAGQIPADCRAQIFDTRKTTPGWRRLEKAAVATGGAHNHRFGLFDAVLIKDNHIAAAGSISQAITQARLAAPEGMVIEVEIDRLDQLDQALSAHPDIILLDNFSLKDLATAVTLTKERCQLEASGGITLDTIGAVARTGVHRISMGALTHTVQPADLGLDIPPLPPATSLS
jgi:nicotinate-nucleotide pyrophosphorylase (carboxylating)